MNYSVEINSGEIEKLELQELFCLKNQAIYLLDECLNAIARKTEDEANPQTQEV